MKTKNKNMKRKYDTTILDKEIKQMKKQSFFNTLKCLAWGLYPFGCALFIALFSLFFAYAIVMMMTEPTIKGY